LSAGEFLGTRNLMKIKYRLYLEGYPFVWTFVVAKYFVKLHNCHLFYFFNKQEWNILTPTNNPERKEKNTK
jgi:hypothetical protein